MASIRPNPTLSDDLINEILVRLPVKSLVRFESVSKTWLSLIKDPAFVKSQLLRAISIETYQSLIVSIYARDNYFPVLHVDSRKFVACLNLPYPRDESDDTCRFRLVGSANGIVCVYATFNTRPTSIYLCNPAIRQYKLIPSSSNDFYRESSNDFYRESERALGFGYDPIDDDFKVVRVGLRSCYYFAEVYSNNRNVWRKVADPIVIPREFHVCVNGFLCGIGQDGMIAFDLNKEVLNGAIKLPFIDDDDDDDDDEDDDDDDHDIVRVIEYNKCISIIKLMDTGHSDDETDRRFYKKINVWTLDDDACLRGGGVEASWTPMLSIDVDSPAELSTYRYFCNGDFLLLSADDCILPTDDSTDYSTDDSTYDCEDAMWILRNADMKEVKTITLSVDMAEQMYVNEMYLYTESLVSLVGFKPLNLNAVEDDN